MPVIFRSDIATTTATKLERHLAERLMPLQEAYSDGHYPTRGVVKLTVDEIPLKATYLVPDDSEGHLVVFVERTDSPAVPVEAGVA